MKEGILLLLLCMSLIVCKASAAPLFPVKVLVNGVDPSNNVAVVKSGESAQVSVEVYGSSASTVLLTECVFDSEPSALGAVLEAYFEKHVELPYQLWPKHYSDAYDVPGFMPAGDYSIKARISYSESSYSGSQEGVYEYSARIRVENEGALSTVLGILLRILPKALVKPLVGLLL